jgi:hypothetical protein
MISTIPISNASCPVVVVSPLVLEEDAKKIEALLSTLEVRLEHTEQMHNLDLLDRLSVLQNHLPVAKSLIQNVYIESCSCKQDEDVFDLVLKHAKTDNTDKLLKDLKQREAIGKTIFDDGLGWLLHCNTTTISEVQIGLIRRVEKDICSGYVMVMLIPSNFDHGARNFVGSINQELFENQQLKKAIFVNNQTLIIHLLENAIMEHLEFVLHHLEG